MKTSRCKEKHAKTEEDVEKIHVLAREVLQHGLDHSVWAESNERFAPVARN